MPTSTLFSLEYDQPPVINAFLKWAGGKTRSVPIIKGLLPAGSFRFIEPFVGSGVVFLNAGYADNVLADINADLITAFRMLQTVKNEFIEECRRLFVPANNQDASFYQLRDEFNRSRNPERRAVLFVYLNRHCFNGLPRFNGRGEFNAPVGSYTKPYFPESEMRAVAEKLSTATLFAQDFRLTLAAAGVDDVVYCDPPYVPLDSTANFTAYSAGGFHPKDHRDLTALCEEAALRGATVLVSNHDTDWTRQLYQRASTILPLMVRRSISCDGANRQPAKELIAVFTPP